MTTATTPTHAIPRSAEAQHWDRCFRGRPPETLDPAQVRAAAGPIRRRFYERIGDVAAHRVLDIGCGLGRLSVMLALEGAHVTAVDTSAAAIDATRRLAEHNGVGDRVRTVHGTTDSLDPATEEPYDLAVGVFILHHIEPFEPFCQHLRRLIAPGGRGVFLENNARNPLLMFCRKYLAGRFGIPRYGDDSEYPFKPRELAMLDATFDKAEAEYPQLLFLGKLNTYVFRHKPIFRPICRTLNATDDLLYRLLPPLRKYSYQQVVSFVAHGSTPNA